MFLGRNPMRDLLRAIEIADEHIRRF